MGDGKDAQGRDKWEAIANGDDGKAQGREIEIARLPFWLDGLTELQKKFGSSPYIYYQYSYCIDSNDTRA